MTGTYIKKTLRTKNVAIVCILLLSLALCYGAYLLLPKVPNDHTKTYKDSTLGFAYPASWQIHLNCDERVADVSLPIGSMEGWRYDTPVQATVVGRFSLHCQGGKTVFDSRIRAAVQDARTCIQQLPPHTEQLPNGLLLGMPSTILGSDERARSITIYAGGCKNGIFSQEIMDFSFVDIGKENGNDNPTVVSRDLLISRGLYNDIKRMAESIRFE